MPLINKTISIVVYIFQNEGTINQIRNGSLGNQLYIPFKQKVVPTKNHAQTWWEVLYIPFKQKVVPTIYINIIFPFELYIPFKQKVVPTST